MKFALLLTLMCVCTPKILIAETSNEIIKPSANEQITHELIGDAILQSMSDFTKICLKVKDLNTAKVAAKKLPILNTKIKKVIAKLSTMPVPSNGERILLTKKLDENDHPLDPIFKFNEAFEKQKDDLDPKAREILENSMSLYMKTFEKQNVLLSQHFNPDEKKAAKKVK